MGYYLNPDKGNFKLALNSEIYVDKTGLIAATNKLINTQQRYVCVSRPRRFGKSIAMSMLANYYDCEGDPSELFRPFEIFNDPGYEAHQGKYEVISIDIQRFLSEAGGSVEKMVKIIRASLGKELREKFGVAGTKLEKLMEGIHQNQGRSFVVLIDEWDCIFRVKKDAKKEQDIFLDFLRSWFKDRSFIALAYMTGILPI
ncbi:MAG: AAA family ATPase, partial [Clostridiales Family XIII bacterium]|nr:AAA family ATPase [Clostridiales Family XIII bacterium]